MFVHTTPNPNGPAPLRFCVPAIMEFLVCEESGTNLGENLRIF